MQIVKYCSNTILNALDAMILDAKINLKKGQKQIFVVPNGSGAELKNRVIYLVAEKATFDVDVIDFSELKCFAKTKPEEKIITQTDGSFFVRQIMIEEEHSLQCFASTQKTLTFASMIFDVILKLKRNGVLCDKLMKSAQNIKDNRLKSKYHDIAFIYEKYEKMLKDKCVFDVADELKFCAKNIRENKELLNTAFNFCCFENFDFCEQQILESLVEQSACVCFSVVKPKTGQSNADIYPNLLANQIEQLAKKFDIKIKEFDDFDLKNAFKQQICENVYALSSSFSKMESNGEIVLLNSTTIHNEVDFVAKQIMWILQNENLRFLDFAICVSDKNLYEPFIKNAFNKMGISYWIGGGVSVDKTQCFKLICEAINCFKNNFNMCDVLSVIYNPAFGLLDETIEFVETMATKYGIEKNLWTQALTNERGGERFKKFEELKKQIVAPIVQFKVDCEKAKTLEQFCTAVMQFLQNVNAEENLKKCDTFKKQNDAGYVLQQSFEKIKKTFENLCEFSANVNIDMSDFISILNNIVGKVGLSKSARSLDSVFVGTADEIRFLNKKYLFCIGANEGVFPASKSDVEIISDGDILSLDELKSIPTITLNNMVKKFRVAQSLVAGEKLYLSYPSTGLSESLMPCGVVDILQNLFSFNGQKLPVVKIEELICDRRAFGGEENRLCFNLSKIDMATEYMSENDLLDTAYQIVADAFSKQNIDINNIVDPTAVPTQIEKAKQLFFKNQTTKISQLENYFECPFAHFLNYGLNLFEKEESAVKPNQIGTILHAVVEKFVGKYAKKELKKQEILQISAEIFENIIAREEFEHLMLDDKNKIIIDGLKAESGKICQAIYYQNEHTRFETKFCEAKFGDKDFAKKAVLNVEGIDFVLNGTVDRVDMFENYVRVVDYKTGKVSSEFKNYHLYNGQKIQLFVYMWAILNGMQQKNLQPAGVFLMPLHNGIADSKAISSFEKYKLNGITLFEEAILKLQDDQVSGAHPKSDIINFSIKNEKISKNKNLVSVAEFNDMLDYSIRVSKQAIAEILSGYIEAKPFESSCKYCSAKSFCGFCRKFEKPVREERIATDEKSFEKEQTNDTTTG